MPVLDAQCGNLAVLADFAWRAIARRNDPPTLFHYADNLARVETDEHGIPFVRPLDVNRFRHELVRSADWRKRNGKDDLVLQTRPPWDLAPDMLAHPVPPVPPLRGLRTGPFLTASGKIRVEPGYDPESRLFYAASAGLQISAIPQNPNVADVAEAKRQILEPWSEIPFVGPADLAHVIALQFTPFIEQLIHGPLPAFLIDKPVPGAGAGLATDVALIPALGRLVAKMSEGSNEDEWRKRITAKLLEGGFAIVVDNVRHRLDSAALALVLTAEYWEDRLLGFSRIVRVPARRVWVFTGNNVQTSDEIRRRMILSRIDPRMERPELRGGFLHADLPRWMIAHRSKFVHAFLTVCQVWDVLGRPEGRATPSLGSFEGWARTMGGLFDLLEIPGFLANLDDMRATSDAKERAWRAFLSLWWDALGAREVGVSELWTMLTEHPDVLAGIDLGDARENALRARLGKRLGSSRDRVFDGRRLEASGTLQGANRWRLVPSS